MALVALVACTDDELPDEGPPPADSAEQVPSGLRVAVVLSVVDGGTDTATLDELRARLEELDEERGADIADLRVTVPDGVGFVGDIAALFAGDGRDLVCLLGEVPAAVVVDLADRFPATRFCAVGTDREDLPDNVQLIAVGQEQLGFVLGAAAQAVAEGGAVAVLSGPDRSDRTRRRAGIATALGDPGLVLEVPVDDEGALDADAFAELLEEADPDDELAAFIVDAPPEVAADLVAVLPAGSALVPARGTEDLGAAVRYRVDVGAVVTHALDRLLADEPADLGQVGFGSGAFDLDVEEATDTVVDAIEQARALLADGEVDLSGPAPPLGAGGAEDDDVDPDEQVPDVVPDEP